ncbi:hypothetical protein IU479_32450 [Nocardia abscessus]|uniref:hypothetical protein n=1 Tax=Nocardia abscessus TaxID=120957 RepID=UPI001894A704|nr:hypothetical protein [Nocardia abscessus]MBF6222798.1 hypothetical protein [Nocardia abscessus]
MTTSLGSYTFLPWLRQGLAQSITAAHGDQSVRRRATTRVDVKLTGQPIAAGPLESSFGRDIDMYGPGEVIGIEQRAIIRVEPRPWITDVEPNYLAHIEFYDEDFPWRYTPAAPAGLRLRPWIALVVLKDTGDPVTSEFRDGAAFGERPLPFIIVKDFAPFPSLDELWAWAHVHTNRHLGSPGQLVAIDVPAAVGQLEKALAGDADIAYSRLLCPRRLETDTAYHAFLVPAYERGRLAGLGLDPDDAPYATASAWADYPNRPEPLNMPFYHRWYFRTGGDGDFESLVRLLKWQTVDHRVGYRDMDVLAPGSNLPPIDDTDLHGVLRLGGALRAPRETLKPADREKRDRYEKWWGVTYPHKFQRRIADFANLTDTFTRKPAHQAKAEAGIPPLDADDVDPIIVSPIYGQWQALQHRLLTDPAGNPLDPDDDWIHELNVDPQYRVPAGFGGDVVRRNQEDYMEAAWQQVGEVLDHNRKAHIAQMLLHLGEAMHAKSVAAVAAAPSRLLSLTAPVQGRVLSEGVTVRHARGLSRTPPVLTSSTLRRIMRPRGPLARRLALTTGPHASAMLEAVNEGVITAAPPKRTPGGLATVEAIAETLSAQRHWPPDWLVRLARRAPWLRWVLLAFGVLALILAVFGILALPLLLLAVLALATAGVLTYAGSVPTVSEALGPDLDRATSIDRFPEIDAQARRLKAALRDWAQFVEAATAAGREEPPTKLDLTTTAARVAVALRPQRTVPLRFLTRVDIAAHVRVQVRDVFDDILYYPRIDVPMYRPLKELSDDHFVPRLNLIGPNTVVALETNQSFIEAYMVGVNHEFSREMLWREYPTDLRGTCLRQFWDVTPYLGASVGDPSGRDRFYDIPPIHTWPRRSRIGEHDHRQDDPAQDRAEIVLAVRGELLKKYPNTVIYAHKAEWAKTNGHIDPSKERTLTVLTTEQLREPPPDLLQTPIYEAKADPDIYFFGFALTAAEVKGGTGDNQSDAPGWYFVLKERPGEPRFGLDTARPTGDNIVTVNDLAWPDMGVTPGAQLDAGALAILPLSEPGVGEGEKKDQHDDDVRVVGAPISAARWAYLLYQMPVMVAVHGAELLREGAY